MIPARNLTQAWRPRGRYQPVVAAVLRGRQKSHDALKPRDFRRPAAATSTAAAAEAGAASPAQNESRLGMRVCTGNAAA